MSDRALLTIITGALLTVNPFTADPQQKGSSPASEASKLVSEITPTTSLETQAVVDTVAGATLSTLRAAESENLTATVETPVEVASSIDRLEHELMSPKTLKMTTRKYAEWKAKTAPLLVDCLQTTELQEKVASLFKAHATMRTRFMAISKIRTSRLRVYENLLMDLQILEAPKPVYDKWIWQIAPILAKGYKDPFIGKSILKMFNEHITERAAAEKKGIPEYKTMGRIESGRIVKRPSIEYHNERTLYATHSRHFGYRSFESDASKVREKTLREAYAESDNHMTEITPADAKSAHEYLKQLIHIDWEDPSNGCNLRCSAAEEALRALNISEEKIFVTHIQGKSLGAASHGRINEWCYHIAIGLELSDGARVVLDPTLAPEGPISVKEWAKRSRIAPLDEKGHPSESPKLAIFDRRAERGDKASLALAKQGLGYYPEYEVQLHASSRQYRSQYDLSKEQPAVRWANTVDLRDRVEMSPMERNPNSGFEEISEVAEDIQ